MQVFHGSYTDIDVIDLSKCVPNKDFGQGFYVTDLQIRTFSMYKFKKYFIPFQSSHTA
jgi:hypothetical protein